MSKLPRCIVCKSAISETHNFYESICVDCGNLCFSKRNQTADLQGMYALVTGGRVSIGYGVALRLLRDGANVIVTTRFPHDAAKRYAQEKDFDRWQNSLHIYGLDLRLLGSIEDFTRHLIQFYPRLDIIINNAAQTIRRPSAFYQHLWEFEQLPNNKLPPKIQKLVKHSYIAEYSSNHESNTISLESRDIQDIQHNFINSAIADDGNHPTIVPQQSSTLFPPGMYSEDGQQVDLRTFNSWLMKDDEVSILELLEVHVVNAIAPFVINSRLKKLMMQKSDNPKFIINVSSMEGRFNDVNKPWRHPHTNMAKAALNQMTCTCAKEYARYKIFMNGVDPGWISFQHPYPKVEAMKQRGVKPPFDIVDAAARICDLIYLGVNEGKTAFGYFFKDYQRISW